jgi:hypothetical protein
MSIQSQAATEQVSSSKVVATIRYGGGLPGPGLVTGATINLYADGSLKADDEVFQEDGNNIKRHFDLTIIDSSSLRKIKNLIPQIQQGGLRLNDGPVCFDLPSATYQVVNGERVIDIYEQANCLISDLTLPEERAVADQIRPYMDSFLNMYLRKAQ